MVKATATLIVAKAPAFIDVDPFEGVGGKAPVAKMAATKVVVTYLPCPNPRHAYAKAFVCHQAFKACKYADDTYKDGKVGKGIGNIRSDFRFDWGASFGSFCGIATAEGLATKAEIEAFTVGTPMVERVGNPTAYPAGKALYGLIKAHVRRMAGMGWPLPQPKDNMVTVACWRLALRADETPEAKAKRLAASEAYIVRMSRGRR